MTNESDPQDSTQEKLDELDRKLKAIEARKPDKSSGAEAELGAGKGYQALGELLGGIFVGLGLGWLVDTWLHTIPFGIIIGTVGGMVIGVYMVVRSAARKNKD